MEHGGQSVVVVLFRQCCLSIYITARKLSLRNEWYWGAAQQKAFQDLKNELSDPNKILAHYDLTAETVVSADASSFGLGAVVTQLQKNGEWRPVAYNSRSMSDAEKRYPQIDKEALAVTWACERFSDLLIGMTFKIETDHKPLISLLGNKDLDILPPRVQRFRIRLMRFNYNIVYVPGK